VTVSVDNYIKMLNKNDLIAEFNEQKRILHLSGINPINISTREDLADAFSYFAAMMEKYIDDGRCYLILDLNKIIIAPDLASDYAELGKPILEKYLYPCGVARYGHQITRLTVMLSHKKLPAIEPNLYATKTEAFEYIDSLIAVNKASMKLKSC